MQRVKIRFRWGIALQINFFVFGVGVGYGAASGGLRPERFISARSENEKSAGLPRRLGRRDEMLPLFLCSHFFAPTFFYAPAFVTAVAQKVVDSGRKLGWRRLYYDEKQ